jgi:hypothetical protein
MWLRVCYKKKIWAKNKFFASLKSLKRGVGSGVDPESDPDPFVRGADPDPHRNVTDPQHWF